MRNFRINVVAFEAPEETRVAVLELDSISIGNFVGVDVPNLCVELGVTSRETITANDLRTDHTRLSSLLNGLLCHLVIDDVVPVLGGFYVGMLSLPDQEQRSGALPALVDIGSRSPTLWDGATSELDL